MSLGERLGLAALHRLDPEKAHDIALGALSRGLAGGPGPVTSERLKTQVLGLDFPNPVGTAGGFDKNGIAIRETLRTGFGFVEVGAVTPRPQPGNPKPRLFRLSEDRAVINRFGFNNNGLEALAQRLEAARGAGVTGVNLGANKDSEDRAEDFVTGLTRLYDLADFFTVNVSSPNTEKLRDLQGKAALENLLRRVVAARDALAEAGARRPVLVKIAPDLSEAEIADVADVALEVGLDGIIATNTTLGRDGLRSAHAGEAGGLSGAPLKARALEVLKRLHRETDGTIPLIGVGGIATAEDAYERIKAGASLVQIYSAMIYEGVSLGRRIAEGLGELMERDGLGSVRDAVGIG
ncbi:MAG: quinone-dependent dihydroorotate dehydrogenase [Pseudomonadota bacterium]